MWQNFWMYALEQRYGKLGQGKRLLTSNITFELLVRSPPGAITDHMRYAFQMWGEIEKRPMEIINTAHTLAKDAEKDTSQYDPAYTKEKRKEAAEHITMYTDGSYDKVSKQSGYGFIAIKGGIQNDNNDGACPMVRRWGPCARTTLERASNNSAELEAQIEAIAWLRDTTNVPRNVPVELRPDSLYAQNIMNGTAQVRVNRELALKARKAWRDLKNFKRGKATCKHVRSHQLNVWNAEADTLANKGAAGLSGWSDSTEAPKDNIPAIIPRRQRPRAHTVSEISRVNRALHVFGVLRIPLIPKVFAPGRIAKQHEEIMNRINQEHATVEDKVKAIIRVNHARDVLLDPTSQRKEGTRLLANESLTRPVVYSIKDCPIDIKALKAFAQTSDADETPTNKHGTAYRASYRTLIHDYLQQVREISNGKGTRGSVSLSYRHTGIGAELVAAGILLGARVYADESSKDPFTALPKKLRHIALAKYGFDFDDDASHPRAAVDLTNIGSEHRQRFLHNRENIMRSVANKLWPGCPPSENRSKVKQLFAAKDMRGSTSAWCNRNGIDDPNKVLDVEVDTDGWTHLPQFTPRGYFQAITEGLDDIDEKWKATTDFISEWKAWYKPTNKDAEGTMQSYLRQEAEAESLNAKWHVLQCVRDCGTRPLNLQHDGLVVACGKIPPDNLRAIFTEESSKALCYTQPVEVKSMKTANPTTPSTEALPAWSYQTALSTPLFFDPYEDQPTNEPWNVRLARERRALQYAEEGFTHIKHIVNKDTVLSPAQFSRAQAGSPKLQGYLELVRHLPRPALKGIGQGPSHDKLEWVQPLTSKLLEFF